MAKKTLYVFRAENGIWRNELSRKIGVDEEALKKIEDEAEVPEEIAQKVIEAYNLSEDYFTADPNAKDKRYKPKNPFKYFLKVSLAWQAVIGIIIGIVMFPATMATNFGLGENIIFDMLKIICKACIVAFSGVYLTSHIVKKTVYGKSLTQYDYIYPYLPAQITISLTIIAEFVPILLAQRIKNTLVLSIIACVIIIIGIVIKGVITAKLLASRVEENEIKRGKTVKKLSVLALLSTALYSLFNVSATMLLDGKVAPLKAASITVEIIALFLIIFGLVVGEKRMQKFNKIWFTILPIIAMIVPAILNALDLIPTF